MLCSNNSVGKSGGNACQSANATYEIKATLRVSASRPGRTEGKPQWGEERAAFLSKLCVLSSKPRALDTGVVPSLCLRVWHSLGSGLPGWVSTVRSFLVFLFLRLSGYWSFTKFYFLTCSVKSLEPPWKPTTVDHPRPHQVRVVGHSLI